MSVNLNTEHNKNDRLLFSEYFKWLPNNCVLIENQIVPFTYYKFIDKE